MLQVLLALIQYAAIALFGIAAIVLTIVAIVRWRKRRPFRALAIAAAASVVLVLAIGSIDLFSAESTDREELVEAFRSNFGFDPPASVAEIKVKNIFIYDASGHWMAFTYDPLVFEDIVAHDQPLQEARAGSKQFDKLLKEAYERNANRPDWARSPQGRTNAVLYKEDFLDHTYSAYYLWVDTVESMVHLHVTYFD